MILVFVSHSHDHSQLGYLRRRFDKLVMLTVHVTNILGSKFRMPISGLTNSSNAVDNGHAFAKSFTESDIAELY